MDSMNMENSAGEKTEVAVCGLHMRGFGLEHQLTKLQAVYDRTTCTSAQYRMVRTNTDPAKPMLVCCAENGTALEVEIWKISIEQIGKFLQQISAPLGLGKICLEDGSQVIGFVGQAGAEKGLHDISSFGGWRYYCEEEKRTNKIFYNCEDVTRK